MNFMKFTVVMITSLLSASVLAGPDQLDILGMVPGVSDLSQVKKIQKPGIEHQGSSGYMAGMFEIGGHLIGCSYSFIDSKLALFGCLTGENGGTKFTEASNIKIFSDLLVGFTKKFGKPDAIKKVPMRTRIGVEHENKIVSWRDSQGNTLRLDLMFGTVDQGILLMESSAEKKRDEKIEAEKEAKKKF
jgi:hypothetical protein